jgi:hypothetical protein
MVEIQKKGTSILSPITSGGEHYEIRSSRIWALLTLQFTHFLFPIWMSAGCLGSSVDRGAAFLRAARFARGLVACFLAFVFTATRFATISALVRRPARLATFLEAGLARVRAFPRFDVVFLRADVRCFRLAMSVSH